MYELIDFMPVMVLFGSVVSGTVGAILGGEAQSDAAIQNRRAAEAINAANYQIFREGRGLYGSSLLPNYVRLPNKGAKGEAILGRNTLDLYRALQRKDHAGRLSEIEGTIAPFEEGLGQAEETAAGIFSGALDREQMAAQEPVSQARTAVASSALEALSETINQIKAINAKKGFGGDSTGVRNLEFDARRRAASAGAEANLANALDVRGLKQRGIATRLGSLNLPFQMARQRAEFENLPEAQIMDEQKRRQGLFDWFKIPQGNFRYDQMPPAPVRHSPWEAVANTSANVGNAALTAWLGSMGT